MAASSSDESCLAPENFHISSSNEGCDIHLNSFTLKCPLCSTPKRNFYCRNCVRLSDFTQTVSRFPESLSEKQQKYRNLQASLKKYSDRCDQLLDKWKIRENFKLEIKRKKERIAILNHLVKSTKKNIADRKKIKEELLSDNQSRGSIIPKYNDKVMNLSSYVANRVSQNLNLHQQNQILLARLKRIIRNEIHKLISIIFPLSEIVLKDEYYKRNQPSSQQYQQRQESNQDTIAALADAKNTSYIRGKWVFHGSGISEIQHCIVAPSLPANGDYSAYIDWLIENKDGVPTSAASEIVPSMILAFRITAALTYATQLVNLLSFYLNVRLPHKLAYGDFCRKLNEQQFTKRVSRLNANIMYLAYTQRVKLSLLNENHTLENISMILNTEVSDLGRFGPVEVSDAPLIRSVDSQVLLDLETGTESESEEENSLRLDWEAVPLLTHDMTPPLPSSSNQTTSIAGGLMTSAAASLASFLRGWAK